MRGIQKLIDWRPARETVAAVDQGAGIARKRRGVAGYGDDSRDF